MEVIMSFKKLNLLFLMISSFISLSAMAPHPLNVNSNRISSYLDLLPNDVSCELNKFRGFRCQSGCAFWLKKDIEFHKEDDPFIISDCSHIKVGDKHLALQKSKNEIEIWHNESNTCIKYLKIDQLQSFKIDEAGNYLLLNTREGIYLYDIENDKKVIIPAVIEMIEKFCVAPDKSRCAIVHQPFSNKNILYRNQDLLGTLSYFNLKGDENIFNTEEPMIKDENDFNCKLGEFCINKAVTRVAFYNSMKKCIEVINLENGQLLCELPLPDYSDKEIEILNSNLQVLSNNLNNFDFASPSAPLELKSNRKRSACNGILHLSPDGHKLAYIDRTRIIHLWHIKNGDYISSEYPIWHIENDKYPDYHGNILKFTNDGRKLLCSYNKISSRTIQIIDANNLSLIKTIFEESNQVPINLIDIASDDTLCAMKITSTNYHSRLIIYGLNNKTILYSIGLPNDCMADDMRFLANNKKIAITMDSDPRTQVCIYNIANEKVQNYLYNNLSIRAAYLLEEAYKCYKDRLSLDLSGEQKKESFNHLPQRLQETICGTIKIKENLKRLCPE